MRIKLLGCLLAAATAIGAVSCKDDLTLDGGSQAPGLAQDDGASLYMSLGVGFYNGNGTRGDENSSTDTPDDADYGTSTGGQEYSQLSEYDVRTAIIVLAKMGTYEYLAHADVNGIIAGDGTGTGGFSSDNYYSFSTMGRFKYSDIAALYDEDGNIKDDYKEGVNVFVFCNPTSDLLSRFEKLGDKDLRDPQDLTGWVNWTGEVLQDPLLPGYTPTVSNSIWQSRSFLMSNAKPAYAELPKVLENWDVYNQDEPFDLSGKNEKNEGKDPDNSEEGGAAWGKQRGTVYVERAVARIDIKAVEDHEDWKYKILGGLSSSVHDGSTSNGEDDENGTSYNFIDVQLTRMSLVNMSKNFNFLRRVSDDGTETNSTIMGVEKPKNYVVDTDYAMKQSEKGYNEGNASDGFNFALFTTGENSADPDLSREFAYARNDWYTQNIADVMKSANMDNDKKYTIWRYVTENTIPQDISGGDSRQVAVQSTGVVFKGLILPGADIDKTYSYTEDAIAAEDNPSEVADQNIRYIPVEVVNALLASSYHLPRTGSDEAAGKREWEPKGTKADKEADLEANAENYSYDYPTLYMFQGSIYAGFKTVVQAAQQYDGPGGLLYQAVNSTLNNYWADLTGFSEDDYDSNTGTTTGVVDFVYKGPDFMNSEEYTPDDPNRWLQLNVKDYNKIVNHVGDLEEPLVQDNETLAKLYYNNFNVVINETVNAKGDNAKDVRTFREMLTSGSDASRFTLYDASNEEVERGGAGWGYYCYYFWWFKHNDNGVDGRMGPMEFATVRNNVYKLTVNKISALGHSLNTLNDPDPLDPETPDEDDKIYIDVTMKVVPWVVRYNQAEF